MRERQRGLSAAIVLLGLAILAALSFFIYSRFLDPSARGSGTDCKGALKNIGSAIEMYSTDYGGHCPQRLEQLTPNYLREIPTCFGRDTYSYATWKELNCPTSHSEADEAARCSKRREEQQQRMADGQTIAENALVCPLSDRPYQLDFPAHYRIHCKGPNHTKIGIPPDYPALDSHLGLQERP